MTNWRVHGRWAHWRRQQVCLAQPLRSGSNGGSKVATSSHGRQVTVPVNSMAHPSRTQSSQPTTPIPKPGTQDANRVNHVGGSLRRTGEFRGKIAADDSQKCPPPFSATGNGELDRLEMYAANGDIVR